MHSSRNCSVRSSGRLLYRGGGCKKMPQKMPQKMQKNFWGGVCSWGVSPPREVSTLGGVCSLGGVCLLQGGVCSGGGCLLQWVSALVAVVSQHALRQTPPPMCGQTDACKNITFATLLRTVKNTKSFWPWLYNVRSQWRSHYFPLHLLLGNPGAPPPKALTIVKPSLYGNLLFQRFMIV